MDSPQKNQDVADTDSNWDDYLLATKSEATPSEAFEHVEQSLQSGFEVGMKLEIPNPDDNSTYWIASVVVICSELLTLRYLGDDRSGDFWLNTKTAEIHPIGFSSANNKKLYPPTALLQKHPDVYSTCEKQLKEIESVSALEDLQTSFMPIDQIKCGMKVKVSEYMDPNSLWIATIVQNIGGRLLLHYDGCDSSTRDFWLFYLSDRLFSIGHAAESNLKYSVPKAIKEFHTDKEWNQILKKSLEDHKNFSFPAHVLESKKILDEHDFKEGMKLEAVNPQNYTQICPATVSKVLSNYYFLVAIDSFEMDDSIDSIMCCNSNSQLIFPVKWAEENGVDLTMPDGYKVAGSKFSWEVYLSFCKATPAPAELFNMCCTSTGLKLYQKLEAVDPFNRNNMYVATIERIVEPIMFLRFDADFKRTIITGVNSLDIYPMGWCASNSYPLRIPVFRSKPKTSTVASPSSMKCDREKSVSSENKAYTQTEQHGKSWCPKIHFNHRCFTGPLLSKSKLAELPKAIGPGAVHLVMNEVISRVVNVAYKSSHVLQILQVHNKPTPNMQQQVIKAKYKGKSYRATIEVVRNSGQVEEFCKKICKKLECCPYLFGPKLIEENCPNDCYKQTKTKFGCQFVKKHKKPGRPPLTTSTCNASDSAVTSKTVESDDIAEEPIKRGPGRRKKRRHWTQLLSDCLNKKDGRNATQDNNESKDEGTGNDSPPSPKPSSVPKKKIKHIPSSSIVTRGAKLPNFGLWHHVSSFHSKRGRPRTRPLRPTFPPRKVGRPLGSKKKSVLLKKESDDEDFFITDEEIEEVLPEPINKCTLKSNPVDWSIEEVAQYIENTECAPIVPLLKKQEIDGQALLMLNILDVQNYLNLRPEPANKFCGIVKNIKLEYYNFFCRNS